jgi:glycosyltransferase involved in cell wall biosynthesis/SAM-dependent methyltransferase
MQSKSEPIYTIIMVAHNALEMVQLSTLRTLRHSFGERAHFIVVDNASNDGTTQWLQLLMERGDIELVLNETNIGHGPGIELARSRVRSPYLVTLDSDAFPLCDDWLSRLCVRLGDRVKITGILHHRDYIHPSCLMIGTSTLNDLKLTFLAEKNQPSRFDVAERISFEVKRHGYCLAGLNRTKAMRRGSISEPVYLGADYEGIVHHQWYTTRNATAAGARVDDVPPEALEQSLSELFEGYHREHRDITVVMGARVRNNEPERLRNLQAVLQALNFQTLPRWCYRIILVEQDQVSRLRTQVAPFVDQYLFAYNPGPYNRGWAFNIGAALPGTREGLLCLIDADLLVPPRFLDQCLNQMRARARALLPYKEVLYLDEPSTCRAIHERLSCPLESVSTAAYSGRIFSTSQGGCIWIQAGLYHEIGGHDERFRGWGAEDREFCDRLARSTFIHRLSERMLHLHHPRPKMDDRWARANQKLSQTRPMRLYNKIGDPDLYRSEEHVLSGDAERRIAGKREWENWHQWDSDRVAKIVQDEANESLSESARRRLASVVIRFGNSLLDVGCGPGALWKHFVPYSQRLSWTGTDVTGNMLSVAHLLFPSVPLVQSDVGDLPFGDGSYDVVLIRHVLEHLPAWLMERALAEAVRVARRAVVLDFYLPPKASNISRTGRVSQNFLETQWAISDLLKPVESRGWEIFQRFSISGHSEEKDEVWVLTYRQLADEWKFPKVSIVMPTYRRPHTIFRTVEMICAQTYSNWELIVIDNAGDARYEFGDRRVRLRRESARASASYARNRGLEYVTGDLVCFFDDDDDMFPNYLECFVETFRDNPSASMVRCGMVVSNLKIDHSYATPECCLRKAFALPIWQNSGSSQDQQYFSKIVAANGWSEEKGDIVTIREALCRANADPRGGLRSGRY